jgi:hypothetical protein
MGKYHWLDFDKPADKDLLDTWWRNGCYVACVFSTKGRTYYILRRTKWGWCRYLWYNSSANFLKKKDRYFGYRRTYYDGPIHCFGFWWWHVYLM